MSRPSTPATLGKRVKFARELRGLGTNELDRALKTRNGYTSRVESDAFLEIGSVKLGRLGAALRVRLDWLVRGIGPIEQADSRN